MLIMENISIAKTKPKTTLMFLHITFIPFLFNYTLQLEVYLGLINFTFPSLIS